MIDLREAWRLIFAEAAPLPPEHGPLADALGRALAAPVLAPVALPPFDRTAMDGWVVRAADTEAAPVRLPVDGDIAAGDAGDAPLSRGSARRISTGAPLPPGGDAIVRLEDGVERDGALETGLAVPVGRHVRRRGEDVEVGDELLAAGAALSPRVLPLLASSGIASVRAHRRARVALITTGSELVPAGRELGPGQIYESNLTALRALVAQTGAELVDLGIAVDDRATIGAAIDRAAAEADVIVATGGVSVGPHDHVRPLLAERGLRELFWRVRIKPGKPVLCGRLGERWVLGLPGNPLSTVTGWLLFGAPLVARLHGHPPSGPTFLPARLAAPAGPSDGRTTLLTAALHADSDGTLCATPTAAQGSHMTASLAAADGFVLVEHDSPPLEIGAAVRVLPIDAPFSGALTRPELEP